MWGRLHFPPTLSEDADNPLSYTGPAAAAGVRLSHQFGGRTPGDVGDADTLPMAAGFGR